MTRVSVSLPAATVTTISGPRGSTLWTRPVMAGAGESDRLRASGRTPMV